MQNNGEVLIEIKNLKKSYGDHVVLDGINTTIKKGEVIAIVGPSGCGKSTFLRSLNKLERPEAGEVIFEGTDILDKKTNVNKVRQKIGMVFQQFNLFPNKTVLQNIMLAPMKLKGVSAEDSKNRAMELLKRVGLLEKAEAYPDSLSGGQKQRLTIARAVVKKPEILILDDSASALDFATDAALRKAISTRIKESTVFIVSQRASTIMGADKIIVLDDGEVCGIGTHKELIDQCEVYKEICMSQLSEKEMGR